MRQMHALDGNPRSNEYPPHRRNVMDETETRAASRPMAARWPPAERLICGCRHVLYGWDGFSADGVLRSKSQALLFSRDCHVVVCRYALSTPNLRGPAGSGQVRSGSRLLRRHVLQLVLRPHLATTIASCLPAEPSIFPLRPILLCRITLQSINRQISVGRSGQSPAPGELFTQLKRPRSQTCDYQSSLIASPATNSASQAVCV